MSWKKLNKFVEFWDKPSLGSTSKNPRNRFMALSIAPFDGEVYRGIARNVYERRGSADVAGFVDFSKLVIVESKDLLKWEVIEDLEIKNLDKVVFSLEKQKKFLGIEDPDILVDEEGNFHLYFTLPYLFHRNKKPYCDVFLGHASGKSFKDLVMQKPVLTPEDKIDGFKELCPSPGKINENFHLVESNNYEEKYFSAISAVKAKDYSSPWEYSHLAFNPLKNKFLWCSAYVSPCRIIKNFKNSPKNLSVLIFNGREEEKIVGGKKVYGDFLPGLALFNPKTGEIPWVSPKPLFKDPLSTGITFASDFVQISDTEGILYAHVNDSFVRAYKLNLEKIRKLLP